MSVTKAEDVGEWLSKLRTDGVATLVGLHQERWKKPGNLVASWAVDVADADEIEARACENLVERKMMRRQMYLAAYVAEGSKPCASLNVSYEVDASELVAADAAPSHAALYRAAVDGSNRMLDAILKTMAMQQQHGEQLVGRMIASDKAHAEVLVQLTEISSLRLEREALAAQQALSREKMAELARQVAPVIQAGIAKWTSAKAGAGPLLALFKSLSGEQLAGIMGALSPEQQLLLSTLVDEAEKPDAKATNGKAVHHGNV